MVSNCVFEHNGPVAYTLKLDPFRSHSGGLSIGSRNVTAPGVSPTITVMNCVFVNNSAFPSAELIQTSSQVFTGNKFTGRGGALGLQLSDPNQFIPALVDNCTFKENSARTWGGAMYVLFADFTYHTLTISRSIFVKNKSNGAGALFGGYFGIGTFDEFAFVNVSRCSFEHNSAEQGGAVYIAMPGIPGQLG